jgi:hypothetical protein
MIRAATPAALLVAVLLCCHGTLWAGESTVNLFDAKKKGWVDLEAIAMYGFEKIEISVVNRTDRRLRLDPAGSVLMPPDPALQRLGLGGVIGGVPGEDSSLIVLGPRGKWKGLVHSVCLDFGKGTPPNGVPFKLSGSPASDEALKVLRYWASHPHIRQATVNDIIWTGQTLATLKSQVVPPWLLESSLAVWGGKIYWRTGLRTLYEMSGDGASWSKIGENLDRVDAAGGQVTGYVFRIPGLRWYNLSARKWEYFFLPKAPEKVLLGPDRSIYVLCQKSLYSYRPGQKKFRPFGTVDAADAALSPASVAPVLAVVRDGDGRVMVYDRQKETWSERPGRDARRVGVTEKSLYARFPKGVFRFQGRWRRLAGPGAEFETGTSRCFLLEKKAISVYDEEKGAVTRMGSLPAGVICKSLDRALDRLYVLDERGRVLRLAAGGTWKVIAAVPEIEKRKK